MKRRLFFLAVAILLTSSAIAVAQDISEIQPRIFDPEITISLQERNMEISFRYEKVAGHIDDATIIVIMEIIRESGETNFSIINSKITNPRKAGETEITSDVITQGRSTYLIPFPEKIKIDYPEEVAAVGVAIADCLGRKSQSVLLGNDLREKKEQKKIGI